MASVELLPILIHYNVTPERVEARVRIYAGERAVHEEAFTFEEGIVQAHAEKDGRATWDERDLCALVPLDDVRSGGETVGQQLRRDILDAPSVAADFDAELRTFQKRYAELPDDVKAATTIVIAEGADLATAQKEAVDAAVKADRERAAPVAAVAAVGG